MRSIWFTDAPLQYCDSVLAAVIAAVVGGAASLWVAIVLRLDMRRYVQSYVRGMCGVCAAAFWLHSDCILVVFWLHPGCILTIVAASQSHFR